MSYTSLCLLSYNRPDFLRECVASIHANAGAPFELIVHDDGSSDPRCRIALDELLQANLISTVISNPAGHNQGVGTAINRMFKIASGDIMVKLDQDLLMLPGFNLKLRALLLENQRNQRRQEVANEGSVGRCAQEPRIGLLGLLHYHHDPVASAKCKLAEWDLDQYRGASHNACDWSRTIPWQQHTHILGSGFAVPRDVYLEHGPLEEHSDAFSEDWVFMRKLTERGLACALLPQDLCHNRGWGVGPSTVVTAHDPSTGQGTVQSIHHGPFTYA